MYKLLLEEAIKDYYFYEPQENINALEDYCTCIEHGKDCASLEEHIFERLEIYLEQVYPIFETLIDLDGLSKRLKEGDTKYDEDEKRKKTAEFDRKTKGPILGRLRGALGVSSLRQGIKDAIHSVKNKAKARARQQVDKAFKTETGQKIRKAIGAGIVNAQKRIRTERERLKTLKKEWDDIKDASSERYKQAERRYNRSRDRLKRLEGSKGLKYRRGVYKSVFIGRKR